MNRSPLIRAAVGTGVGITSFIIGYTILYARHARDIEESIQPIETILAIFQAEPIGAWRVVGWLFYGAHFVDTRITAAVGPIETTISVNLVQEGAETAEILYLLPPVVLFIAGIAIAAYLGVGSAIEGAKVGSLITIGYILAVGIGLVVFAYNGIRPDPIPALVFAGILYPLLFGGLGGVTAGVLRDR